MKRLIANLIVGIVGLGCGLQTQAQSKFSGVLLSGHNEGFLAGNINLIVSGGQVSFQSTLFQPYVTGTSLEPVLVVQNKAIPLDYGTGTPGRFQLGEFLAPIPGWTPYCGDYPGIDPGFYVPVYFDGTRFTGSFTAFRGLEHLLLARGGTLALQVHGTAGAFQDPLFTASLVFATPVFTSRFSATLSGTNEIPQNTSPSSGTTSFTLTGNCLSYGLALDRGFAWTSAGIFGPARPHSSSTNLVADLSTPTQIQIPGGPDSTATVVYLGFVTLSEEAVKQLKLGKLFVNLPTAQYPQGELRGQILPVDKEDGKLNRK